MNLITNRFAGAATATATKAALFPYLTMKQEKVVTKPHEFSRFQSLFYFEEVSPKKSRIVRFSGVNEVRRLPGLLIYLTYF